MPILPNVVLFQLVWIITVVSAGAGLWWPGLLALAGFAAYVLPRSPWPRCDLLLVCVACLLGLAIDSAYVQLDLLRFAEPVPFTGLAPIWILGMWMSFALTLNHSLRLFKTHLWWSALFGLLGGPIAYWVAGTRFAAVEVIGPPWIAYAAIGVAWALVTPALLLLARHCLPRLDPPAAHTAAN